MRAFEQRLWCVGYWASLVVFACSGVAQAERLNTLFICVDDLNDWITPLGGHPDAKTPNFERLAAMGVTYTNAHCAAPACNPSRAATMTGIAPHRSGVYVNNSVWRNSPLLKDAETIPQCFARHGYTTTGSGEIFHTNFPDPQSWQSYWPHLRVQRPEPALPTESLSLSGLNKGHFDWGALPHAFEEHSDAKVVGYVVDWLTQEHDEPFFIACGIYRPHLPWYLPQEYLDRFDLQSIHLPETMATDAEDLPKLAMKNRRLSDHRAVTSGNKWRHAVQADLASIAFADDCLGVVLDALNSGPHAQNTIVVLWSDHGWQLGEKQTWRKFSLWERATRTALFLAGPGIPKGQRVDRPVSLLDIYPALTQLCGIEAAATLDGISLVNKDSAKQRAGVITTWGSGNHSLRTKRYRYTRYADGGEELYDHQNDHQEWTNIAGRPEQADLKTELAAHLPNQNAPNVPGDANSPSFYKRLDAQVQILRQAGIAEALQSR